MVHHRRPTGTRRWVKPTPLWQWGLDDEAKPPHDKSVAWRESIIRLRVSPRPSYTHTQEPLITHSNFVPLGDGALHCVPHLCLIRASFAAGLPLVFAPLGDGRDALPLASFMHLAITIPCLLDHTLPYMMIHYTTCNLV